MVVIDMEMPKSCNDCGISIFGCICGKPISDIEGIDILHERLSDCPLHELPKARWIPNSDFSWWKCSNCERDVFSASIEDLLEFHKFCGRCGAKMEVKSEVDE